MTSTVDSVDVKKRIVTLKDDKGNIHALCGISTNITEHKHQQQEIHQLAFYDALTGLPNRRMLLDRLQHAVSLCERQQHAAQGALLFIDLDHFKDLNDTLGHAMGDQLLQRAGVCEIEVIESLLAEGAPLRADGPHRAAGTAPAAMGSAK